jgi:uracil-DNA glycosylase family 4
MGSPKVRLAALWERVRDCTRCPLHKTRNQLVFGEGAPGADIMFVGEAPGAQEDRTGRPFVGNSGKLLGRTLERCGVGRSDVYIANVLKCRPPDNRDPVETEIRTCCPVLEAQIGIVRPRVLIALGRFAGNYLGGFSEPQTLTWLRRQDLLYENPRIDMYGIPLRVLAHPSYILRQCRKGTHFSLGAFVQGLTRAVSLANGESKEERA